MQRDSDVTRIQSREVVHLHWSLCPLPAFGFHGNTICSILRFVLARLLSPLNIQSSGSDPFSFYLFLTSSLTFFFFCLFVFRFWSETPSFSHKKSISYCCGDCLWSVCKSAWLTVKPALLRIPTTPFPPQDWEGFSYWTGALCESNQAFFHLFISLFIDVYMTYIYCIFCDIHLIIICPPIHNIANLPTVYITKVCLFLWLLFFHFNIFFCFPCFWHLHLHFQEVSDILSPWTIKDKLVKNQLAPTNLLNYTLSLVL